MIYSSLLSEEWIIGIIIEAKLKLFKIPSPYVEIKNISSKNITETIEILEKEKIHQTFLSLGLIVSQEIILGGVMYH